MPSWGVGGGGWKCLLGGVGNAFLGGVGNAFLGGLEMPSWGGWKCLLGGGGNAFLGGLEMPSPSLNISKLPSLAGPYFKKLNSR